LALPPCPPEACQNTLADAFALELREGGENVKL
jgi:hypothetical protein